MIDKTPTMKLHGHGIYQCFCTKYGTYKDLLSDDSFCHDFKKDMALGSILSTSVSVLISVMNALIAIVNIALIKRIGFNYNSQLINKVMQ